MKPEAFKQRLKKIAIDVAYLIVVLFTILVIVRLSQPSETPTDDIDLFGPYFGIFLAIQFIVPLFVAEFDLFYYFRFSWLQRERGDEFRHRTNKRSAIISLVMMVSLSFILVAWPVIPFIQFLWAIGYLLFRIITCITWRLEDKASSEQK